jgi:3-methyladenine DNA glycosylase AlkD
MTTAEILLELERFGDKQTKLTHIRHGAKEPLFGVKIADLKKILKKTKKNHELALELFNSGNSDAMYLAGLMADEDKMTEAQLNDWVVKANWYYLSEFAVPWVAAETKHAFKLALQWIQSDEERIAAAGWATLSYFAGLKNDEEIDIDTYSALLDKITSEIHSAKNRVRYTMNGFVIATGAYIKPLNDKAKSVASKIGKVSVDMNGTACKVPLASEYLEKIKSKGIIGKKRKSSRC